MVFEWWRYTAGFNFYNGIMTDVGHLHKFALRSNIYFFKSATLQAGSTSFKTRYRIFRCSNDFISLMVTINT